MLKNKDIYSFQKLALQPFSANFYEPNLIDTIKTLPLKGRDQVYSFVKKNNLGPLWIEILGTDNIEKIWSKEQAHKLDNQYQNIVSRYFQHQKIIKNDNPHF